MFKIIYEEKGVLKRHECPDFNLQNGWVVALDNDMVWFNKDNVLKIEKI